MPSGATELEVVVVDWPVTTPLVAVVVVVVVVVDWPVSAQAASDAAAAQATAASGRIREPIVRLLGRVDTRGQYGVCRRKLACRIKSRIHKNNVGADGARAMAGPYRRRA